MQKYIDLLNMPGWVPFIGLMAGKSPLSTRFVEAGILALIPIIVGAIWMIPRIEGQLEAYTKTQIVGMAQYSTSMGNLATEVKEGREATNRMQLSIAILESSLSRIEEKVDDIDQIANTKVRSIEGRIDSLEKLIRSK